MTLASQIAQQVRKLERRAELGEELARLALTYALPRTGMIPVRILQRVQAKARRVLRGAAK